MEVQFISNRPKIKFSELPVGTLFTYPLEDDDLEQGLYVKVDAEQVITVKSIRMAAGRENEPAKVGFRFKEKPDNEVLLIKSLQVNL
ncbi:hypothetical protein PP740_gp018 [Stenotrophomonas phage Philippe]|uniref:Uncharacterized protein n=1 Tax=Stenotrophomonas phage Philippe TaxID=2859655 RepID=A0AAE8BIF6_9CAUD|nr:hypothetical protein PP740_gp018 [Stenotrophomonas phage Philippe]QYW02217.1 hypothetical protein CPT_Philippe_018 [Stenotrophomonas phage Philippe]